MEAFLVRAKAISEGRQKKRKSLRATTKQEAATERKRHHCFPERRSARREPTEKKQERLFAKQGAKRLFLLLRVASNIIRLSLAHAFGHHVVGAKAASIAKSISFLTALNVVFGQGFVAKISTTEEESA